MNVRLGLAVCVVITAAEGCAPHLEPRVSMDVDISGWIDLSFTCAISDVEWGRSQASDRDVPVHINCGNYPNDSTPGVSFDIEGGRDDDGWHGTLGDDHIPGRGQVWDATQPKHGWYWVAGDFHSPDSDDPGEAPWDEATVNAACLVDIDPRPYTGHIECSEMGLYRHTESWFPDDIGTVDITLDWVPSSSQGWDVSSETSFVPAPTGL